MRTHIADRRPSRPSVPNTVPVMNDDYFGSHGSCCLLTAEPQYRIKSEMGSRVEPSCRHSAAL
jgi:hypothetical protein